MPTWARRFHRRRSLRRGPGRPPRRSPPVGPGAAPPGRVAARGHPPAGSPSPAPQRPRESSPNTWADNAGVPSRSLVVRGDRVGAPLARACPDHHEPVPRQRHGPRLVARNVYAVWVAHRPIVLLAPGLVRRDGRRNLILALHFPRVGRGA